LQGTPSSEHLGPHTLPGPQLPLQHSESPMHGAPLGEHGPAHTPPLQMLVQHSSFEPQSVPAGEQPPHTPPLHAELQQSPEVMHAKPFGRHMS
jgi:hypothetical protein